MTKEEAKDLIDRIDEMGIMNPAYYKLGLNDEPNKLRFMDDYAKQAQWITDAYAALSSYWNSSAAKPSKSTKTN
tara:strand:- start:171 stop:392 length:222 start_codon:yes stop_codon:yes gene_type:complete